jgi:hypothetical protein
MKYGHAAKEAIDGRRPRQIAYDKHAQAAMALTARS